MPQNLAPLPESEFSDSIPDNVCECGADLRPHEGVCTSCRQAYQSERYVQPRSEFE